MIPQRRRETVSGRHGIREPNALDRMLEILQGEENDSSGTQLCITRGVPGRNHWRQHKALCLFILNWSYRQVFEGHTNGDGGAALWQSSHLLLVCVMPWVRQKDVAQIVECLPNRYKALGTQPKYTRQGGTYFCNPCGQEGKAEGSALISYIESLRPSWDTWYLLSQTK